MPRGIRTELGGTGASSPTTVAALPASPPIGTVATVTNGASPEDMTVGGGTNVVTGRWNGTQWVVFGAGGDDVIDGGTF